MKYRRMLQSHNYVRILSTAAFSVVTAVIIMIFLLVFIKAGNNLNLSFFLEKPSGFPIGSEGGVFPAIVGSLAFTLIASVSASILALIVALYLEFYCKSEKYGDAIRVVVGVIAGIPSIILGLFGYSFLVVYLGFGISVLSGGLVLGLMIFPYIEIKLERIFRDINEVYKISTYALGVNTFYYIVHIIIPLGWRNMVSIISLASSLAMGATAPILLTGAVFYAKAPKSIFSPAMALPLHLYNLVGENISIGNAFATAGVLLILLVVLNLITWSFSYSGEGR
jgi:phosphate transport system permease protein